MCRTRILSFLLFFAAIAGVFAGLTGCSPEQSRFSGNKPLRIAATLFPQYDFAKRIGGDRAEVVKLLPAGTESHSFEPSARDILTISEADLFLYTGPQMEPWAQTVLKGAGGNVRAVDLSEGISLLHTGEGEEHSHDHTHDHGHDEETDPHIWTSPKNAMHMVRAVSEAMIAADPEGAAYYRERTDAYLAELEALDTELRGIAENAGKRPLIFGGRFAFLYLCREYGFRWHAAFDSCAADSEPSAAVITGLIDRARDCGAKIIFYEELTDPKIAKMIAQETGAGLRMLHSCHNVTQKELEDGVSYLSLMRQNAENIRTALSS